MTTWHLFLAIAGLVALGVGGELLVRSSVQLARGLGLTPLLIGVTVVSLGTSAPELAVSLKAAVAGKAEVSVGNVVGSNLLNTLVVLGISALIVPLVVAQRLVWWDVPIMIAATALVWWLGSDGWLRASDGGLLLGLLAAYLVMAVLLSRRESASVQAEYGQEFAGDAGMSVPKSCAILVAGLVLLIFGADWFVEAASVMALALGVSELVVSLTIVAFGTSLPELVTAVIAALRGENDIAVGNVVGSNIMNLLLILGLSSFFATGGLAVAQQVTDFDLPFTLVAAVACLPIFWTGHRMERTEGALFLLAYAVYLCELVMTATGHSAAEVARNTLYFVVAPLMALSILASLARTMRAGSQPPPTGS
ncbi:MAG: calcium/sodium antiporter [Candidatus Binatia bacterium]|nr:calcium/sodium antiporter [Candidatus Binatia bacterium]